MIILRLKHSYLSFILLFALTIGNISIVIAQTDYRISVTNLDEFIWTCNTCNEEEMEEIFGNDWNSGKYVFFSGLKEGARMKWEITTTDENFEFLSIKTGAMEEAFRVLFDLWKWTDDSKWGEEDGNSEIVHFSDPEHYLDFYIQNSYPDMGYTPFWFPNPIEDYFENMDWYEWYNVEGKILTCELEEAKIIAVYNAKGIVKDYKIYNENNEIIVDITYKSSIPGFELYVVLGITSIFSAGIIYVIRQKVFINRRD